MWAPLPSEHLFSLLGILGDTQGFCAAGQPLVSHPRCRGHVPCWSGHWGSLFCARLIPGKPVRMSWPPGGRNRPSDTSLTGLSASQARRPCSCGLEALRPVHGPHRRAPPSPLSPLCELPIPTLVPAHCRARCPGLHPRFPRAGATQETRQGPTPLVWVSGSSTPVVGM